MFGNKNKYGEMHMNDITQKRHCEVNNMDAYNKYVRDIQCKNRLISVLLGIWSFMNKKPSNLQLHIHVSSLAPLH